MSAKNAVGTVNKALRTVFHAVWQGYENDNCRYRRTAFGRSPSGSQSSFIIGHRHVSIPHAEWGGLLNRPKYGDFHRRPNIFESLVLADFVAEVV
jgi:hypothetical protein